jgi:hypothetical protein
MGAGHGEPGFLSPSGFAMSSLRTTTEPRSSPCSPITTWRRRAGPSAWPFPSEAGAAGVSKRFASHVLRREACSVSGIPAYRVDFEVANVDQLQLTPEARWVRQRVVLVRAPFEHTIKHRQLKDQLPVVLVAGLTSAPEDFERLVKHLDLLLDRVVIGSSKDALASSQPVANTCRVEAAAPAVAAPAPSTSAEPEAPSAGAAPGSVAAPVVPSSAAAPVAPVPPLPRRETRRRAPQRPLPQRLRRRCPLRLLS